jgi:transcriptional regulator with XRE-family HTH domain
MAQIAALVDALKSALKSAGITYAGVAARLELSESSVKRKFSRQEFSLAELDRICGLCAMDISDLVKLMEQRRGRLRALTADQEREIAGDLSLLVVTVCVLNRWTFDNILEYYVFDELELVQMLAKLDRLRIIELQPGNRIKLLVAPNFHWLPNGPIEQVFLKAIQRDFFTARFDREDQELMVLNGMLSPTANAAFRKKMEQLAREFDLLNREDSTLPIDERTGYTVLLALRDWRYERFAALRAPDH